MFLIWGVEIPWMHSFCLVSGYTTHKNCSLMQLILICMRARTIFISIDEGDTSSYVLRGVSQKRRPNLHPVQCSSDWTSRNAPQFCAHFIISRRHLYLYFSSFAQTRFCSRLKTCLALLHEFLSTWGLPVSVEKSAALPFTRLKIDRHPP